MKILVCDDDASNRKMLSEALRMANCQVVEAANGNEGVLLAKAEKPELILMDHTMPDMKGYDAIKIIRKERGLENVPFVMITGDFEVQGYVDQDNPANCAFLPKPYSVEQLMTTIELALGRPFPSS